MSFLEKATRLVDNRVFSSSGLSDEWTIGGKTLQGILEETDVEDGGVYNTELILEVRAKSLTDIKTLLHGLTENDLAVRVADGIAFKIAYIFKPIDLTVNIQLRTFNA